LANSDKKRRARGKAKQYGARSEIDQEGQITEGKAYTTKADKHGQDAGRS
jgi:hypothetical protein